MTDTTLVVVMSDQRSGSQRSDSHALNALPAELRKVHTIRLLRHAFTCAQIRERAIAYADQVYVDSYTNRKVRKAFINQLYDILRQENDFLRGYVRVFQKVRSPPKRKKTVRASIVSGGGVQESTQAPIVLPPPPVQSRSVTEYIQFCRKVKAERHPSEYVGKMQQLWREHKGMQPRPRQRYITRKEQRVAAERLEVMQRRLLLSRGWNVQETLQSGRALQELRRVQGEDESSGEEGVMNDSDGNDSDFT